MTHTTPVKNERKWRWLTRTAHSSLITIWTGPQRPKLYNPHIGWDQPHPGQQRIFCAQELLKTTGLTIPANRPVKVLFTAKILNTKAKVKK